MLSCAESPGLHSHGGGAVGPPVGLPQNLHSDGLPNQPADVRSGPGRSKSPTNAPDKNHTHAMESIWLPELGQENVRGQLLNVNSPKLPANPTATSSTHAVSLSQIPDYYDSVYDRLLNNITRHASEGPQVVRSSHLVGVSLGV